MDKREQRNQQKGSLKRLKRSAPEDKSSPDVMTSSEAKVHQKLPSLEAASPEAEVYHQKQE